ncbi:MAG: ferredoxin [Thermodesulfobacteriota bacterium]|nr:ferredoxin [Thermodesulfobacteriota bacterium]
MHQDLSTYLRKKSLNLGYIKVAELSDYSEPCVEEAIKYCPEDCISWEEG